MARITRRGFVQASGALAAAPALAAITASAQGTPPDIGNLRAEKDIVFGKGGDVDLLLDVYHPPEGVTPKRLALVHLFGGDTGAACARTAEPSARSPRRRVIGEQAGMAGTAAHSIFISYRRAAAELL